MPAIDSAALIVARFLKAHHYSNSYQAFVEEAGLPSDAGDAGSSSLTLERLLEEKRLFDQSVNFEKLSLNDTQQGWNYEAPSVPHIVGALSGSANILNVLVHKFDNVDHLFVATSDRKVDILTLPDLRLKTSWTTQQDSPVLAQVVIGGSHISASMSGSITVTDIATGRMTERRKDHSKYVVALASWTASDVHLLASAGWDNKITIYRISNSTSTALPFLGDPLVQIRLDTKPESIAIVQHPQSDIPVLVLTRTDSSHLHFYAITSEVKSLGRQNLAPNSNAWVAFTPSSIALCPTDNTKIAVATNSTPHMKVIIADLLVPALTAHEILEPQTAREESLAQQVRADKENEAIKLHCNTMSAQTPYSSPLIVWRPDGQGVWVNGDDGLIRGIDIVSGKLVSRLQCHDPATKVRTLCAARNNEDKEILVSGGFDHRVVVWTVS